MRSARRRDVSARRSRSSWPQGAHRLLVPYLALPLFQRYRYHRTFQVFLVVGVAFLLTRLIGVFTGSIGQRLAAAGAQARPTLSLARRLLTGAVVVFAGLAILALFGVNLTATLAGLGIGGIALAFAAQKSLENVFGGFLVLSDKILRVGDTVPDREYDRRRRGRDALRDAPPDVRADRSSTSRTGRS